MSRSHTDKEFQLFVNIDKIDYVIGQGRRKIANFMYVLTEVATYIATKNKQERTEFLMPRTKKALLEWKAHLEHSRHRKKIKVVEDVFVFCRLNGTPITRFDKAWNNVCSIAGIEDFHYHDLRHTFCSNLIMAGSDLKETRDMIGHKDITSTDRYTHLSTLHKQALQKKLSERYHEVQ